MRSDEGLFISKNNKQKKMSINGLNEDRYIKVGQLNIYIYIYMYVRIRVCFK